MNGKFVKTFLVFTFLFITFFPAIRESDSNIIAQSENHNSIDGLYDALIQNPMDIDARYELAKQFYYRKDYKNSLLHFSYLIPVTDDGEITLFYEQVKNEYETVLTREISRYLLLLESMPVNKATADLIFRNEKEIGEFDHSERVFTEYLRLDPEDREIREKLIELYLIVGKNEEAYKELNLYLMKYPEEEEANYTMYKLAALLKKYSKRYDDFFYSNRRDESLIYLAFIEKNRDNSEAAMDYLKNYEGFDFVNPDISDMLYREQLSFVAQKEQKGNLLEEARDALLYSECEKATNLFNEYVDQYDADSLTLKQAAEANYCAGKYDSALELYEDYFGTYLTNEEDIRKRANCYQKTGKNFLALDEYISLLKKHPEDEELLVGLARTYNQAGLYKESRTFYNKAADLFPTSFYILDERDALSDFDRRTFGYFPHLFGYSWEFQKRLEVVPKFNHYSDGEGYLRIGGGLGTEINLLRILQVGIDFQRFSLENLNGGQNYTEYGSYFNFSPVDFLSLETRFSSMLFGKEDHHFESEAKLAYHSELINAHVHYFNGDASKIFKHQELTFNRIHAKMYGGEGYVYFPRGMIVGAEYDLFQTEAFTPSDPNLLRVVENIGNRMAIIGKIKVFDEYFAGYEYFYADYKRVLNYYYTPQDYIEHKITFDTPYFYFEPFYLRAHGEFGVVPENTLFTKRLSFDAKGNLTPDLIITASGGLNWEYRFLNEYTSRFFSINLKYVVL